MKKEPKWYYSRYRGETDSSGRKVILHKRPLRCPYCGKVMDFRKPIFYGYRSDMDWYWTCSSCELTLPNLRNFNKEFLEAARKKHRSNLKKDLREIRIRYDYLKRLFNSYGKYFTTKEKRERLIETIEEHYS